LHMSAGSVAGPQALGWQPLAWGPVLYRLPLPFTQTRSIRIVSLNEFRNACPLNSFGRRMQVRILAYQRWLICLDRRRLRRVGADIPAAAISIDESAPGVAFGVVPDALGPTLAVTAYSMVPACLVPGDNLQVGAAAVKPVVIEEYDFVPFRRWQDLTVQVAQAILSIYFFVPNGIPLPAIALGPVAPSEVIDKLEVCVVNDGDLALRKWDWLHEVNLRVCVDRHHWRLFVSPSLQMDEVAGTVGAEQHQYLECTGWFSRAQEDFQLNNSVHVNWVVRLNGDRTVFARAGEKRHHHRKVVVTSISFGHLSVGGLSIGVSSLQVAIQWLLSHSSVFQCDRQKMHISKDLRHFSSWKESLL
jgi:hypothetical protein